MISSSTVLLVSYLSFPGFSIFMSNLGIGSMAFILYKLGREFFFKYYLIPYLVRFLRTLIMVDNSSLEVREPLDCHVHFFAPLRPYYPPLQEGRMVFPSRRCCYRR